MSCYYPLNAIKYSVDDKNYIRVFSKEKWDLRSRTMKELESHGENLLKCDEIKLPCGKCIGCRLDYSRQWAERCMIEAKQFKHNYFLTITYNNENLHYNHVRNVESGVVVSVPTLFPVDLTNFMKRLRKHYGSGVRFFACGEYGEQYERPHYHIILFNCDIDDLIFHHNKNGATFYTSPTIEKLWPLGFNLISEVSWETCAYTARYVMKKQKGKGSFEYYSDKGVLPEFVRMSRKPGIGRKYFDDNFMKIYRSDILTYRDGNPIRPPKYYDRLFDITNHDDLELIKLRRQDYAKNATALSLSKTSLSEDEFLRVKEDYKRDQISTLKNRSLQDF